MNPTIAEDLERGLASYSTIPFYMHQPICQYVNNHRPPGKFLKAVLKNNLSESIIRADAQNLAALKDWIFLLHNFMPFNCHGSVENYQNWISKDG